MTTTSPAPRSTADARRATVVSCAITAFARTGYYATPVTDVAEAAKISPAYVFRLFPSKQVLLDTMADALLEDVGRAPDASAPWEAVVQGVAGTYNRYSYMDEKRAALESWGALWN